MFKKRASLSARMHEPSRQEQRALSAIFCQLLFFCWNRRKTIEDLKSDVFDNLPKMTRRKKKQKLLVSQTADAFDLPEPRYTRLHTVKVGKLLWHYNLVEYSAVCQENHLRYNTVYEYLCRLPSIPFEYYRVFFVSIITYYLLTSPNILCQNMQIFFVNITVYSQRILPTISCSVPRPWRHAPVRLRHRATRRDPCRGRPGHRDALIPLGWRVGKLETCWGTFSGQVVWGARGQRWSVYRCPVAS